MAACTSTTVVVVYTHHRHQLPPTSVNMLPGRAWLKLTQKGAKMADRDLVFCILRSWWWGLFCWLIGWLVDWLIGWLVVGCGLCVVCWCCCCCCLQIVVIPYPVLISKAAVFTEITCYVLVAIVFPGHTFWSANPSIQIVQMPRTRSPEQDLCMICMGVSGVITLPFLEGSSNANVWWFSGIYLCFWFFVHCLGW